MAKKQIKKTKIKEHGRKSNQPSKVIPKNAKGRYDAKITSAQVGEINRKGRASGRHYPPQVTRFLSERREKYLSEGISLPQALAIAYDQARQKFGERVITKPNSSNLKSAFGIRGVSDDELEEAIDLYTTFHDFEPDEILEEHVPDNSVIAGKVVTKLGKADTITYASNKWHKRNKDKLEYYIHELGKDCELLANETDSGTELIIRDPKGRLKVKASGING